MKYYLGIDLGSSAIKMTLLGEDGSCTGPFSREIGGIFPAPGWTEQDPEGWYGAFCGLFREMIHQSSISPENIAGITVDAATHTTVLLDEKFRPLRPAIMWNDQRSTAEAEAFSEKYGEMIFEKTYHSPSSMWSLCQMQWVRNKEPGIWGQVRHVLFAKDYLRYRLGGENATDYIDAQGSMLLDMRTMAWDGELCGLLGITEDMLPKLLDPADVAGYVNESCAAETGLVKGTPIFAGTSDTAMEVLAAGAVRPGDATMKLATSGRICVITEKAYPSGILVNYSHVVKGLWYPGSGTRSCATSLRWFKDNFCDGEVIAAREAGAAGMAGITPYVLLDRMAGETPPGAEGLIFHPYLLGEFTPYQDPRLRASFIGASMGHTRAHFARAIMEGCVYSLMDCWQALHEVGVPVPDSFRLIGGGAAGRTWCQIVADVFGMPVKKPAISDSSFGSAMVACVAGGLVKDYEEAVRMFAPAETEILPDPGNARIYREMFGLYKEVQKALAPIYHR